MTNLQNALSKVTDLKFLSPSPSQAASAYASAVSQPSLHPRDPATHPLTTLQYPISTSGRRAKHWIGTAKMGTDDTRLGGSAIVDTNTKVYGTNNLFVVDASIFQGVMTGNPSADDPYSCRARPTSILGLAAPALRAKYGQCGGAKWGGSAVCASGSTCQWLHGNYYQCL